jgi:tetratricopeptide (TPR) repeat protein
MNKNEALVAYIEAQLFEEEVCGLTLWRENLQESIINADFLLSISLLKLLFEYNTFFGSDNSSLNSEYKVYFILNKFYQRDWQDIEKTILDTIKTLKEDHLNSILDYILGLYYLYQGKLYLSKTLLEKTVKKRKKELGKLWWHAISEYIENLRMLGLLKSAKKIILTTDLQNAPNELSVDYLLTEGMTYVFLGKLNEAEICYEKAYVKSKNNNLYYRYYRTCYYQSELFRLKNDYQKSLNLSNIAIQGLQDSDKYRMALSLRYYSITLICNKNFALAQKYINEALNIFENVGSHTSSGISYKIKATLLFFLNQESKADFYFEKSINKLEKTKC